MQRGISQIIFRMRPSAPLDVCQVVNMSFNLNNHYIFTLHIKARDDSWNRSQFMRLQRDDQRGTKYLHAPDPCFWVQIWTNVELLFFFTFLTYVTGLKLQLLLPGCIIMVFRYLQTCVFGVNTFNVLYERQCPKCKWMQPIDLLMFTL